MDWEDTRITAAEMIDYLQRFPQDKPVAIITVDCTREKKVCFNDKEVIFVTDEEQPVIMININTAQIIEIEKLHKEACADNRNPAKDVKSPELPTKKCYG